MDLGFLRPLYENPPDWPASGYVSVYLDTAPTDNAPNEVGLRLRSAREALAAARDTSARLDEFRAQSWTGRLASAAPWRGWTPR